MNLKTWMLGLLGATATVEAYTKIPKSEINQAMSILNNARRTINAKQPSAAAMPYVTWNYQLEQTLNTFLAATPNSWLWQQNETAKEYGARYNAEVLMKIPPFDTYFPNYGFLFHDGCENTASAISYGFRFRLIGQAHCFDYALCSTGTLPPLHGSINHYQNCASPFQPISHASCSWSWQYYPMAVDDQVSDIACALTGAPGPNEAGYRPNHYLCYYGVVTSAPKAAPYVSGPACSACPEFTTCVKRLCV